MDRTLPRDWTTSVKVNEVPSSWSMTTTRETVPGSHFVLVPLLDQAGRAVRDRVLELADRFGRAVVAIGDDLVGDGEVVGVRPVLHLPARGALGLAGIGGATEVERVGRRGVAAGQELGH